ncbi:MAG TPA: hypothetical protein VMT36_04010 [Candidatus Saccharimonadia bacterium]|nr:hypothetical protein [Candidatus Saccharimonadia bacterium]
MIHEALHRPIPVELTEDPRIRRRVRRLAAVSAVALGLIWVLAVATTTAPAWVAVVLFAGWLSMPTLLLASLRDARLRYGLVVPSVLVSVGLLAIVVGSSPGAIAALGWLLILVGVLLGGLMGLWFWFRVVPVPVALDAPDGAARWAIIAIHVGLIVVGIGLAASALVAV